MEYVEVLLELLDFVEVLHVVEEPIRTNEVRLPDLDCGLLVQVSKAL
jgi:hypothetical protein